MNYIAWNARRHIVLVIVCVLTSLPGCVTGAENGANRSSASRVDLLPHGSLAHWAREGEWNTQDGVLRCLPVQNAWSDSRLGYKHPLPKHGAITFEWRRTQLNAARTEADPGFALQTKQAIPGQRGRHPSIEFVFADFRLCLVNEMKKPAEEIGGSSSLSVGPAEDRSIRSEGWNTSRIAYADTILELWLNETLVYQIDARDEVLRAPESEPVELEAVEQVLGKWINRTDTSVRLLLVCSSPEERFEGVEVRNLQIAALESHDLGDGPTTERDKIVTSATDLINRHPIYTSLTLNRNAAESLRISLLPPRPFASLIDLPNPGATSDPSLIRNYSREFWEGAVEASQLKSMFLATYQLDANNARVPESAASRSLAKVWVFAWELKTDGHAAALHAHLSKNYVDDTSAAWAVGPYVIYMTGGDEAPAKRRQLEEYLRQQSNSAGVGR